MFLDAEAVRARLLGPMDLRFGERQLPPLDSARAESLLGLMGRPTDGAVACKPAEAYDAIPLPTLGPGGGPCAEPPSGHG
jgi:hypothetical protein